MAVLVYPMLALMGLGNYPLAIVCAVVLFILDCAYAPSAFAVVTELLPTRFRYTGAALGINVPLALFGGSAPYASAWLIEHTGSSRSSACMIGAAVILSLFTTTKIKETAGGALTECPAARHTCSRRAARTTTRTSRTGVLGHLPAASRERIMSTNALEFCGLTARAARPTA
ncbi:hypothetical protein BAY59_27375 [Prauserella coralliicola]|nr:hypothetical protein BAY59_27375 [Prauserella coralliicola]